MQPQRAPQPVAIPSRNSTMIKQEKVTDDAIRAARGACPEASHIPIVSSDQGNSTATIRAIDGENHPEAFKEITIVDDPSTSFETPAYAKRDPISACTNSKAKSVRRLPTCGLLIRPACESASNDTRLR